MDAKKLDKWADLLLDTGKRNNLINFKDLRASTVEVLAPSSDVLFKILDSATSVEVFDPKSIAEDNESNATDYERIKQTKSNTAEKSNYFWQNIQVRLRVKTKF